MKKTPPKSIRVSNLNLTQMQEGLERFQNEASCATNRGGYKSNLHVLGEIHILKIATVPTLYIIIRCELLF
jgi:hypothetical protein